MTSSCPARTQHQAVLLWGLCCYPKRRSYLHLLILSCFVATVGDLPIISLSCQAILSHTKNVLTTLYISNNILSTAVVTAGSGMISDSFFSLCKFSNDLITKLWCCSLRQYINQGPAGLFFQQTMKQTIHAISYSWFPQFFSTTPTNHPRESSNTLISQLRSPFLTRCWNFSGTRVPAANMMLFLFLSTCSHCASFFSFD